MSEIQTHLMTEADIDAIHEMENLCFAIPWSREALEGELKNSCARYIVITDDGVPCGYAGVWFVLDEGHITNIAVHPDYRGRGLGEKVTRAMIQLAADSGMSWMTLECRRSNTVAQNLYHKLGFIDVGYRKRYYADNREDALVMALEDMPEGNPENDPFLQSE